MKFQSTVSDLKQLDLSSRSSNVHISFASRFAIVFPADINNGLHDWLHPPPQGASTAPGARYLNLPLPLSNQRIRRRLNRSEYEDVGISQHSEI